jgi:tRNA-2-methylthio-N6-dimethylallyladenosine synthase
MQGCDNFCTYCIVPTVRGREISRPPEDIISEIEQAVKHGAREIILLGQNVNSYGKKVAGKHRHGHPGFAQLLEMADSVDGVERLRFTTSHPRDLDEATCLCYGRLKSLCEHIHLPVQSGATPVLKRMNRHYTREEYLEKVAMLKSACPDISVTTDLIVGFPGETEEDFEQTMSLLEEVRYDQIFVFKYSPRPGTPASRFQDQVAEEIKTRRIEAVLRLQEKIGLEQYSKLENRNVEILVEARGKGSSLDMQGRTRGNHVVHFQATPDLLGRLITVKIERACKHSLRGTITVPPVC